jgi:hypothetical protein
MGYRESKIFFRKIIVCPLRVLKWPFIGELAWKRPNRPVGEAQDPCGIWQNLWKPMWYCLL